MTQKDYLEQVRDSVDEVLNKTPYDLLEFSSREDEKKYIEQKTKEFDITKALLKNRDTDGIMVITETERYAISPVFIHDNAFVNLFKYIYNGATHYYKPDPIAFYNNLGHVLIRVTHKANDEIGFDPYIPEKINNYQLLELQKIIRELNDVYKELEYRKGRTNDINMNNIKYGIRIIRDSISDNVNTLKK